MIVLFPYSVCRKCDFWVKGHMYFPFGPAESYVPGRAGSGSRSSQHLQL